MNIFLRGMVPLVGFKSEVVTYERHERLAGESHYPLSKMLALAFDGITSLSNKPIRLITGAGIFVSLISFIGVIWAIIEAAMGQRGGRLGLHYLHRLLCGRRAAGVLRRDRRVYRQNLYGDESRPRYIISERTWAPYERKYHG